MKENARKCWIPPEERRWRGLDSALRAIGLRECVVCHEQKPLVEFRLRYDLPVEALINLSRRCHDCRNAAIRVSRDTPNPLKGMGF